MCTCGGQIIISPTSQGPWIRTSQSSHWISLSERPSCLHDTVFIMKIFFAWCSIHHVSWNNIMLHFLICFVLLICWWNLNMMVEHSIVLLIMQVEADWSTHVSWKNILCYISDFRKTCSMWHEILWLGKLNEASDDHKPFKNLIIAESSIASHVGHSNTNCEIWMQIVQGMMQYNIL